MGFSTMPTGGEPGDDDVRSLIEGSERYRSLFTHNPHAVFSLDLEGYFTDSNPAGQQMSGFDLEELRSMSFLDLITPEDRQLSLDAFATVLGGAPTQLEARMRDRDGSVHDMNLVVVPVEIDGAVVGVHGVAEDVTERNRIARELLEARRAAEEANAAKSLLLANMSHELRTPLTTMLATAELLEDSDLDPLQTRFVHTMQRSGHRLTRLIEDILDFSRIEAGALELRVEPFEPRALMDDVVAWAKPLAAAKGLRFEVDVDPNPPPPLMGDTLRLTQVLTNLVDNAVKFTDTGHVVLRGEVLKEREDALCVRMVVSDSGIGIPEHLTETLFAPFTQADPSATRSHEGTGLGLAICHELVGLMGGTIELDSEVGVGTTCTVELTLPRAEPRT